MKARRKRERERSAAHAALSDRGLTVVTARRSTALSVVGGEVIGHEAGTGAEWQGKVLRCRDWPPFTVEIRTLFNALGKSITWRWRETDEVVGVQNP